MLWAREFGRLQKTGLEIDMPPVFLLPQLIFFFLRSEPPNFAGHLLLYTVRDFNGPIFNAPNHLKILGLGLAQTRAPPHILHPQLPG